jgi:hypothetical protein
MVIIKCYNPIQVYEAKIIKMMLIVKMHIDVITIIVAQLEIKGNK